MRAWAWMCKIPFLTHIDYWKNDVGRVCINCGRVLVPDWLREAKSK